MKKITTTLLIFFVIGYASLFSQSTFTWGGTYGGSGTNRTYTTTVSGITMSATINNNQNVWQASSPSNSPLYCLASGLYLANDWTSTAGNNVVTITFSSPVAAPITFSISDMNSNYCDEVSNSQDCYFWDEVQVTATTPAGLGILPTASSGSGQTNTNSGNNRIIRAKPEANSGTYGCFTNNFTVGASGQCVKTLTISYKNYTGESATIYQADPRFQYIIITQLLSSAPPAAPTNVTFPTSCANSAITLTGTGTNASSNWYTGGCNSGTLVGTGANLVVSPSSSTTYYVSNSECGACKTVTITPLAPPNPLPVNSCTSGNTINLNASGGGTYQWNGPNGFSSTAQNPTIISAGTASMGTYTVVVTGTNGCTATTTTTVVNGSGSCVLPIELVSFNGNCSNNKKSFSWTTASETNNNFFTLEHSTDAINFTEASFVSASGTTTTVNFYSTSITEENFEFQYYRLKQTDFDGHFTYSDIITLECNEGKPVYSSIKLYPNPSTNQLNINFGFAVGGQYNISIKNIIGQEIKSVNYLKIEDNDITLFINDLSNGIYFLKIVDVSNNITIPTMKFVVEKQ